ncbi:407_t:CDS:2, partial [Rhizophagus irregularis]
REKLPLRNIFIKKNLMENFENSILMEIENMEKVEKDITKKELEI